MRSWLNGFEMRTVRSLDEALVALAEEPGTWTPFAGGTDLMVLLEAGKLPPGRFLDIWQVPQLKGVRVSKEAVFVGALTTYTELIDNAVIASEFPLIRRAAQETGAVAIQNRGTVGGNIANASPAADLPPALLVYDAAVELASVRGTRTVPYDGFHRGYKQMDLAHDELIVGVSVPRGRAEWRQAYRKVGTRRAQAISKVCFAAAGLLHDGRIEDVRIALGSVAPTVVRARRTEALLRGRRVQPSLVITACAALGEEIAPIDDLRSTEAYRRRVASNLLEDFLS